VRFIICVTYKPVWALSLALFNRCLQTSRCNRTNSGDST
jgi:hypothetical protein